MLGIGGIASFVIGSIILLDTDVPGFEIARSLIAGMAFAGALLALLIATYFARSRKRRVVTGAEQLLDEPAVALGDFERADPVRVRGEIWNAVSREAVKEGQRLRIVRVNGLTLGSGPRHQRILGQSTDAWGIKVSNVEIKHVDLDGTPPPATGEG